MSTTAPRQDVTVDAAESPAERALEMSRALFVSSPVVVVVAANAPGSLREAGSTAERLGVPVLVSPTASLADPAPTTTPSPARDDLRAELERLHVSTVATVGRVGTLDVGNREVVSTTTVHTSRAPHPIAAGTVAVLATADPTNGAAIATARAAGADVTTLGVGETNLQSAPDAITALHAARGSSIVLLGTDFSGTRDPEWSVAAAKTGSQWAAGGQTFFPDNRFVALYGVPDTPSLGVLGEQGVSATIARAQSVAASFSAFSDRKVTPMLEVIATVAAGAPGPGNTYSNELPVTELEPFVDAASAANMPVVIDLQPGRTDFLTQAKHYESLLLKPNVSLALDPEWRLTASQVPLQQIGSVSASEVNSVSAWLAELIDKNGLPPKMFVLHQFRSDMLQDRDLIDTTHPELSTVIHVDGQGSQPDKQATWNTLHADAPQNVAWGWKNFYDEDAPMLTPEQTMTEVSPTPDLISYQ